MTISFGVTLAKRSCLCQAVICTQRYGCWRLFVRVIFIERLCFDNEFALQMVLLFFQANAQITLIATTLPTHHRLLMRTLFLDSKGWLLKYTSHEHVYCNVWPLFLLNATFQREVTVCTARSRQGKLPHQQSTAVFADGFCSICSQCFQHAFQSDFFTSILTVHRDSNDASLFNTVVWKWFD